MSSIGTNSEDLVLNADGSSSEIKLKIDGTEKASISSAGAFTSTTIDATALTGTIASFTSTGIDDNATSTAITIDSLESLGLGTTSPFNTRAGSFTISNEAPTIYMEDTNSGGSGVGQILYTSGDLTYSTGSRNGTGTSGSTEHFRIKNDGNVGIGTTSPHSGAKLHIVDGAGTVPTMTTGDILTIQNNDGTGDNAGFTAIAGTAGVSYINFGDSGDKNVGGLNYYHSDNTLRFFANASERMRINEGSTYGKTMIEIGESFVGGNGVNFGVLSIVADCGNGQQGIAMKNANTHHWNGAHTFMSFHNSSATNAGEISHTASTTVNYSTSSDYRLKENQVAISDGIDRVKQLKPYRFNWKAEPDRIVDGFFAHEVQGIVDEAITGTKDAMETRTNCVLSSDGTMIVSGITEALWTEGKADEIYPSDSTWEASKDFIKAQNIDQSKLVPLLVGALQEAIARIETLENE